MVRNPQSGEVSSLHSYFNKHLVSVAQLNSLLKTHQQSGQAVPQVKINVVTRHPVAQVQEPSDDEGNQGQQEDQKPARELS